MRHLRFAALCLVAASAAPGPVRGDQAGPPATPDIQNTIWRTTRNCGVNSIYVLLRSNGKAPDYAELMSNLMARSGGQMNSLKDLRDVAAERGLRCRFGKTTADGLAALPTPLVAHVEKETANSGHFILVLRVGPEVVDIMDGTTGSVTAVSTREFAQTWTGYVLYPAPPWYATVPAWAAALAVVVAGAAVAALADRARRRIRRPAAVTV